MPYLTWEHFMITQIGLKNMTVERDCISGTWSTARTTSQKIDGWFHRECVSFTADPMKCEL